MARRSRLKIFYGARATEEALLRDAEASLATVTVRDLGLPLRIVVPSRHLRAHLAAQLMARRRRATLGLSLHTLHGLALEILEKAGEAPPRGDLLFDSLVERMAQEEDALAEPLGELVEGFQPVCGTVRDLLDAGLETSLAQAAEEALAADGPSKSPRGSVRRAQALVRTAARTDRAMELLAIGRSSNLLRRARHLLEANPEGLVPARALFIHGFADATGVAADFLEALLRYRDAWFYLDLPPDPGAEDRREESFAERLRERISAIAPEEEPAEETTSIPSPRLSLLRAAGPEEEAAAVAESLQQRLLEGCRPEGLAVVCRDLNGYHLLLEHHLARRGVPFSFPGQATSFAPMGRAGRTLVALLQQGEESPVENWLGSLYLEPTRGPGHRERLRMELRLAFHSLGAGRLGQVAALNLDPLLRHGSFLLPFVRGLGEEEPTEANADAASSATGGLRAARRHLEADSLRNAQEAVRALCGRLRDWPRLAPLREHWDHLETLLREDLLWPEEGIHGNIYRALAEARQQLPGDLPISWQELLRILKSALGKIEGTKLGGSGAGVQILSVTEARSLTFEELYLLGLNRDVFPRSIREDPLFPDDLRRNLAGLLPDIPIKSRGYSEEHYLFAQLLSSSPRVHLSWADQDEDGRAAAPSPLLERLRWNSAQSLEELTQGGLFDLPEDLGSWLRKPIDEAAMLTGLYGDRASFCRIAPMALKTARSALKVCPAGAQEPTEERRGAALLRTLEELDPDLRTSQGRQLARSLGPYQGFIGSPGGLDPRHRKLFVTHLEATAGCPWQTFLQRLLRLQPSPDPLQALPELSPLLVGQLVHAVLEHIVAGDARASGDLDAALARPVSSPPWPLPTALEELMGKAAREVLFAAGIHLPGLAQPLVERARPHLEVARSLLWEGSPEGLLALGAELQGALTLSESPGRQRLLSFRADLVEALEGGVRLTDFKTGKPIDTGKTPATRRKNFLKAVLRGERLQAVAYLLAAEELAGNAEGRYLFLTPDLDPAVREFKASSPDTDLKEAFQEAVLKILHSWDGGIFFPRLVDPKGEDEPIRCSYCTVAEACSRRDSGARRRLFEAAEALGQRIESGPSLTEQETAFLDLWTLPEAT